MIWEHPAGLARPSPIGRVLIVCCSADDLRWLGEGLLILCLINALFRDRRTDTLAGTPYQLRTKTSPQGARAAEATASLV